jgi:hypothetical protein
MVIMMLPNQDIQKSVPGLFYNLMKMTAYKYNVNNIIVDMSPSQSVFNRYILLSSHGFVIPTCIDIQVR